MSIWCNVTNDIMSIWCNIIMTRFALIPEMYIIFRFSQNHRLGPYSCSADNWTACDPIQEKFSFSSSCAEMTLDSTWWLSVELCSLFITNHSEGSPRRTSPSYKMHIVLNENHFKRLPFREVQIDFFWRCHNVGLFNWCQTVNEWANNILLHSLEMSSLFYDLIQFSIWYLLITFLAFNT